MSIKLVAFDIDGTLIPRGTTTIDDMTKEAIKTLEKKGIKVVISTGRIVTFMQKDVIETIKSDYCISINGGAITDGEYNIIKTYPMSEDNFFKIIALADKYHFGIGFKYPKEIAAYNEYDLYMSIYDPKGLYTKLISDYSTTRDYHLTHGMPVGCFWIGENDVLAKAADELVTMTCVYSYDKGRECFNSDVSKSEALKWVADKLGITMDEVMAFGDSDNDIDMLKAAEIGIAMGNANDVTKAIADYVTDDCDKQGIPKALEHFGLI